MIKRADDNEDMTVSFDEFYHIVVNRGFMKNRKLVWLMIYEKAHINV